MHKADFGAPGTDGHLCSCSKLSLGHLGDLICLFPTNLICQIFLGMMKLVPFENLVSAAW